MLIKLQNGLICNYNHFHYNDYNFMLDGINYEKDEYNGKCCRLEDSCCLKADCDGKSVRRISGTDYKQLLDKIKALIPTKEDLEKRAID